ncbi:MAG: hypothetical protein GC189_09785 [Alphaproteobacteria bacterium]|nr:hypothetical protein [Alphaproteobacteria bacterium]
MPDAAGSPPREKKQAALLIHGIGEQRPMATLWKLVELVWLKAPCAPGAPERKVYSEPDEASGIFELRRLSTNFNADGKRTDFFEFYWAHLMHGNELSDVLAWLGALAARDRETIPPQLHKAWRSLRIAAMAIAAVIALVLGTSLFAGLGGQLALMAFVVLAGVASFVALVLADQIFFSPILGDAARYLRPVPKNIQSRQQIREQGLRLLDSLHKSGKYDRIIIVGHSLGGVIAYELIHHYWGRRNRLTERSSGVQGAIASAEAAGRRLVDEETSETITAWRAAQHDMFDALRNDCGPDGAPLWLISDMVTLGCPLAHAETLLAKNPEMFRQLLERRELAACPPQFETFPGGQRRFSYCRAQGETDNPDAAPRALHNGAVFSAVRWTNIYFPLDGVLRGDLIGGPAGACFGAGVLDVPARAPREGGWFPHMQYFNADSDPVWGDPSWADHRDAIRAAMALEQPAPLDRVGEAVHHAAP